MAKNEMPMEKGRGPNEVTIVHDGVRRIIDVDAELNVDEQDIRTEYIAQAGKFAWYAVVHAAAMKRTDNAKMALDIARADIDVAKAKANERLKEEMTVREKDKKGVEKIKLPSQTSIDALLESQPEVKEARANVLVSQQAYTQAHYEQEVVRAVKDAFVHRRDMLIQLGADTRMEQRDRA